MVPVLLGLRGRLGDPQRRWVWVTPAVCLLSVGLLLTPGLAGHASTGSSPVLGTLLDVGHLGAAAAWLGGLALLATFLVTRDPGDALPDEPSVVTRPVSAVAYVAVAVVVATGVVQSIRQVGSFYALFHTSYGVTLLVKIGLVVVLVALGAASRRIVHGGGGPLRWVLPDRWSGRSDDADDVGRSRLRRSVLAELAVAVAVLGVTAVLVNAVPAGQAVAQPFTYSVSTLGVQVNTIVSPAVAGSTNEIHVYVLSSSGTPRAVPELDVSLSLPSESIGPLTVPLTLAGPGHYYANAVDIPVAGSWVLHLTVRTDAIDEQEVTTTLQVR
jgi:copper transport protein